MRPLFALTIITLIFAAPCIYAHESRPAYLELTQVSDETFEVLWKVPARGDLRLGIYARLPESCSAIGEPVRYESGGAFVERWSVSCHGGLAGEEVFIDGLPATLTDVLVRIAWSNGTTQVLRVAPSAPSFMVDASPGVVDVAGTYLLLGIEHILFGIDHLLFVFALLLLVEGTRRLIETVTAFTVAHSITLAAATLGYVHAPQRPVEAAIALSIVFVACEIVYLHRGQPSLTRQRPWIVAFTFGLLHGFGFAGALNEVGLPQQAIPIALLFFNLGVEAGQLLFIAAVLLCLWAFKKLSRYRAHWHAPKWALLTPAYAIGTIAAFWFIERTLAFW